MQQNKPIIIGKLTKTGNNESLLIGGIDEVKYVNSTDYEILNKMRGFFTFSQIAEKCHCDEAQVHIIFEKYKGDRYLKLLKDWNKLHWCKSCRRYINAHASTCPHCNETLYQVPISPPCDPVFSLGEDYAFVIGRIETELQRNINGDVFILLNTVLYENFFSWEIVVEGKVILEIQFRSWKESEWEYKFLEDFYKINWEKKFPKIEEQRAEQLESNSAFIEALEKDTLAFIKNAFPLLTPDEKNLPLVYFSGGKESMVMHKILKNGKIKSQLLFASVGLDFPDDVEFIKGLAVDKEFLSGDPIYLEIADKERAWKTLKEKGVLKVHDMWCRSELKYPSRNKAVETVYGDREYIALEGSRKYENDFRRGHPMVNFISDIKGYRNSKQVWLHPLAFWNGFDIWAYIFSHNVKINPLYYKGFHRTTCWMCPLVNPFHLRQSLKYGKELWGGVDELEFEKAYEAFSQWNNPF